MSCANEMNANIFCNVTRTQCAGVSKYDKVKISVSQVWTREIISISEECADQADTDHIDTALL